MELPDLIEHILNKPEDGALEENEDIDSKNDNLEVEKINGNMKSRRAKIRKDLTINTEPLITRNSTIEELKLKLENKEILVRRSPTSPIPPTTPTTPQKKSPDFEDDLEDKKSFQDEGEYSPISPHSPSMIPDGRTPPLLTDDGLIAPRKPANPVRENPERQSLHRELMFNQKIGKNVLNQKSELQKALEKHKDNIAKKQLDLHIQEKTPELKKVIEDRARRLENPPKKEENEDDKVINKEFIEARMKLRHANELK